MELITPIPQITIDAFSGDATLTGALQQVAADRRMLRTTLNHHNGDIRAAINLYKSQPAPHLIITELKGSEGAMTAALAELSELCEAGTKVIAAGSLNDVGVYRTLIRSGVSDYLVLPIDPLGIIKSISDAFSNHRDAPLGRVVAVMGSKGGVGSSTVAHNLAWTISNVLTTSTIMIDLDLPFGTAGLAFDESTQHGIFDALRQPERIDTALIDRLLSGSRERLNLLGGHGDLTEMPGSAEAGVSSLLAVVRRQAPAVLVDIPNVWSNWSQRVLMEADDVVVVSSPDIANLRNTKNIFAWLENRRSADRKSNLVVNMTGMAKRRELPMKEFLSALNLEKSWAIQHQPAIFTTCGDNGQMVGEVKPKSQANEVFVKLAHELMGRPLTKSSKAGPFKGIFSRLTSKTAPETE